MCPVHLSSACEGDLITLALVTVKFSGYQMSPRDAKDHRKLLRPFPCLGLIEHVDRQPPSGAYNADARNFFRGLLAFLTDVGNAAR